MTLSRDVQIVDGTAELLRLLERLDNSYEVEEVAAPPFDGDDIASTVTCTSYRQAYEFDARSLAGHLQRLDRAVFVALSAGQPMGYIAVEKSWNTLAVIADLAVTRNSRRGSVGRRLMDAAVFWARNQELRGIRLETQNNKLPACRFYASCGFRLG